MEITRRRITFRNAKGELVTVTRKIMIEEDEDRNLVDKKTVNEKVSTEPARTAYDTLMANARPKRGRPKGSRNKWRPT